MKKKMFRSVLCLLCVVFLLPGAAFAETEEGYSDPVVPVEESMQLFAYLSETELMAASGAGGWEGTLKINADGTFTGDYHDSDFDMISVVSFSGRFIPSGTERRGSGNYALWVEDLTTEQTPGTEGKDEYGDRIVYTEAPLYDREYVLVTLPGTPDAEIPEMVRGEIGGTFDVWSNYSGYITLTRDDGWGFFAEPSRRWEGPVSTTPEEDADIGDPASTGPSGNPGFKLPQNITRIANGHLRYDDGLIAFEMPGDAYPWWVSSNGQSYSIFPEGTDASTITVNVPSPPEHQDIKDFTLTETNTPYLNVYRVAIAQIPEGYDVAELVWNFDANGRETGYTTIAGRTGRYKRITAADGMAISYLGKGYDVRSYTYTFIPLGGNRVLCIDNGEYSDPERSSALQMLLDTLEIRDDLYAVPPDGTAVVPSEPAEGTDIGDPASTGPAENPSEELPKYTTRLPNGNLRYDDGVVAFEAPGDSIPMQNGSKDTSGTVFPEGTEIKGVALLIPSPPENQTFYDYIWTETQKPYLIVVRVGVVQLPEGTNAEEFAWNVYPDGETTGYSTIKGRIARYKTHAATGMAFMFSGSTDYIIPLTGNRLLWIQYGNYSDADRSSALQLFLDTLEIRDDLYAVPPDGTAAAPEVGTDIGDPASTGPEEGTAPAETPAEEAAPAVEPAPSQDGWSGYWMTRDDSLSELVITPNGDGTLHAEVFFLKTLNMHATLTPQDDRNMRFETDYGALIGTLTRQEDGTLSLKLSGGYSFNDEEASEYNEYYARTFMYYPAAYEEMWYEDPAQASAGSDEDWLGSWTVKKGDRQADLLIERNGSSFWARITLSNGLYFTSPLEPSGDNVMDFNEEGGYYCMLRLNRKLRMIVMEEIGAEQESVYDWLYAFPYSIVEFRRLGAGLDIPDELQQPNDAAEHVHTLPGQDTADAGIGTPARTDESNGTPSASQPRQAELQPIPGRDGYMQVPVSRVDATSYIRGKDDATAYAPFRMTDGVETTAFQFSTKITPLGGAWMYFDFDAPVRLDELWIKNGFWKKTDGKDQYTRNCRIKKMAVFVLREDTGEEELVAEVTLKDDKTRKDWQVIPLNGAENVIGVSIRVDSVYKGTKFKTDVCVSEIMFVQATGQ